MLRIFLAPKREMALPPVSARQDRAARPDYVSPPVRKAERPPKIRDAVSEMFSPVNLLYYSAYLDVNIYSTILYIITCTFVCFRQIHENTAAPRV
jgi:hypothetical protein